MSDHNWNLVGNEWAVELLRQQITRGTTRHAYLFAGPSGVGRRTLALRLAQALNCTQPVEVGIPCGHCRECKQIEAMQHPDLTIVQADSEGGTLKVDQVREARRTLTLKPYQSKYRVTIFLRFQEANDNAANALLKILEEAPSYVILVLTADTPEQLLPTIVSRCEVLRLRPLSLETVESYLTQHGADSDQARLNAHISGGRLGYALRLLSDPSALEFRNEKLNEAQSFITASRVDKFSYAEKLSKDKDSMRNVLLLWLSYWRDVLLRAGESSVPIANIDRAQEIESIAERVSMSEARRVVSELETALSQLESNVNARLLAEVILLDWPKI
ncbi:MAG: DNA polymerase III subunit delta' [Anaerolineales bacterium]